MAKRGLSKEIIYDEAERLVQEQGYDKLAIRELAARLEVKPASLYNHIKGIEELNVNIALKAAVRMKDTLEEAVKGKNTDEAFMAGTRAYRSFAMENKELYKALIHMPLLDDEAVRHAGFQSFSPLRDVIVKYGLPHKEMVNFVRWLRSAMHGFIELTNNGFMQRGDVTQDETYEEMMGNYLSFLNIKSKEGKV